MLLWVSCVSVCAVGQLCAWVTVCVCMCAAVGELCVCVVGELLVVSCVWCAAMGELCVCVCAAVGELCVAV